LREFIKDQQIFHFASPDEGIQAELNGLSAWNG